MTTRDTVLIALFAALCVVFSLIPPVPVPLVPVPVTLQTLGVMMAALVLGPRRGAAAVGVYLVLAAVGLPVLPGGRGGLGVFLGPTGGFLVGMLAGAFAIGWLAQVWGRAGAGWRQGLGYVAACLLGGVGVVYALGVPWLSFAAGMPLEKAALAVFVFIPGDLLKAVLAAWLAVRVGRVWPVAAGGPVSG